MTRYEKLLSENMKYLEIRKEREKQEQVQTSPRKSSQENPK